MYVFFSLPNKHYMEYTNNRKLSGSQEAQLFKIIRAHKKTSGPLRLKFFTVQK